MERTIETARQMGATVESLEEGIRYPCAGARIRSVLRPDPPGVPHRYAVCDDGCSLHCGWNLKDSGERI